MNPILDQPQTFDVEALAESSGWALANQEISLRADVQSNLHDLFLYRAFAPYARSIDLSFSTFHGDPLVPIANRYYPGYQETILGSEGLILSKRLIAPVQSADDRALIWQLECQAEGDYLVRMDVAIDWGEALTQRMVDGLLVAQRDPQPGQGIYSQSSAASTRIFGNPQAPPESLTLDDAAGTARLTYYVLVNGTVDVSLLLTLSDVGEQMAWSAFLALRDSERALEQNTRAWQRVVRTARLWTPDIAFNRALDGARRTGVQQYVRLRGGFAPADRELAHLPALVALLDTLDPVLSRNLLAHARRLAERSQGRLPTLFPARSEAPIAPTARELAHTNHAYLQALQQHLTRHFDAPLLDEHYEAITLCAEVLIASRQELQTGAAIAELRALEDALRMALRLATLRRDGVNAVRWESEACEYKRVADEYLTSDPSPLEREESAPLSTGEAPAVGLPPLSRGEGPGVRSPWAIPAAWTTPADAPAQWTEVWAATQFAGDAVWQGLGITIERGVIRIKPTYPREWAWWALLGLPTPLGALSLLWDGATLHSTLAVKTSMPTQVHQSIEIAGVEEFDNDPRFLLRNGEDITRFAPTFVPAVHS